MTQSCASSCARPRKGRGRAPGCLAMGPTRWDRHSETWVATITIPPGTDPEHVDDEVAAAGVRERLNLPDLDLEVLRHSRWQVEAGARRALRRGSRVPRRRQGATPALAPRRARAQQRDPGRPEPDLEARRGAREAVRHRRSWTPTKLERRPVARRNVEFATFCFFEFEPAIAPGFGVLPNAPVEHNRARAGGAVRGFAGRRGAPAATARVHGHPQDRVRVRGHGAGVRVRRQFRGRARRDASAAARPRGAGVRPGRAPRPPAPARGPRPRRRGDDDPRSPGAGRLPAAGRGGRAASWCAAAEALGIRADAIGPEEDLRAADGAWYELRGHEDEGAVFVRPDGHLAFRSAGAVPDPLATLGRAYDVAVARRRTA